MQVTRNRLLAATVFGDWADRAGLLAVTDIKNSHDSEFHGHAKFAKPH
jgi:hypothetical protein